MKNISNFPNMVSLRTRILSAVVFAALLAGGLSACVPLAVTGVAVGGMAVVDRRSVGTQTEDEGLEWKISAAITEKFGEKVHINQTSYNRRVLLTGEAPDEETRRQAEQLVAAMPNVQGVWNEIQTGPVSSLGARSSDAYITSKVKARFVDAGQFRPMLVKVVTEAETVYLMGIATRKEADAAIQIARTTAGVKKVISVIEIITEEKARELDPKPQENQREQGSERIG
ncbi:MAG: BON domain-containing protein [Betaproteobacteria bacterium]|nr:BON domain-containing protein [Betaproteobacteria bacterium]